MNEYNHIIHVATCDCNYFHKLPDELIAMIMTYLTSKDLWNFMLTSKELAIKTCGLRRNFILTPEQFSRMQIKQPICASTIHHLIDPWRLKIPPKFRRIVVAGVNIKSSEVMRILNMILLPLREVKNHVTEINISAITIPPSFIHDIVQFCPRLQKLVLGNTAGPCDKVLTQLFSKAMHNTNGGKSLVKFEVNNNNFFHGCAFVNSKITSLTHVILNNCKKLHFQHLQYLITTNKSIIHVELNNCSNDKSGPTTDVILNSLGNTSIRTLILTTHEKYKLRCDAWKIRDGFVQASALHKLTLNGLIGLDPAIVSRIVLNSPNLRYLNISHINIGNESFYTQNSKIDTLVITETLGINESFWHTSFPRLKSIQMPGSNLISGKNIQTIVYSNQRTLEVINLCKVQYIGHASHIMRLLIEENEDYKISPIKIIMDPCTLRYYLTDYWAKRLASNPVVTLINNETMS